MFRTTNGSITLILPAGLDAEIDALVTNGTIESDYPVSVHGRIRRRSLREVIGRGGHTIELRTTNGSIALRESWPKHNRPETS